MADGPREELSQEDMEVGPVVTLLALDLDSEERSSAEDMEAGLAVD